MARRVSSHVDIPSADLLPSTGNGWTGAAFTIRAYKAVSGAFAWSVWDLCGGRSGRWRRRRKHYGCSHAAVCLQYLRRSNKLGGGRGYHLDKCLLKRGGLGGGRECDCRGYCHTAGCNAGHGDVVKIYARCCRKRLADLTPKRGIKGRIAKLGNVQLIKVERDIYHCGGRKGGRQRGAHCW